MEMTRERIGFTFELSDILLSLQMSPQLCKSCSGLCNPRENLWFGAIICLKLVTVTNFCPFTFISLWMPLALFLISLVLSALISILYLVQVLSRLSVRASSSCSSSARASMSSANCNISGNISAAYANLPIMFFQGIRHDPFDKNVEDGGCQKTSLPYSDSCSEPFSYAAIHLDCTCSLVIELLNGAN